MITAEKEQEVLQVAENLHAQAPDWVTFYRNTLGLRGCVRRAFPTRELLAEFEKTKAFREIQRMLTGLRKRGPVPADPEDPTRVVTVRLPKSLHEALRVEAHEHHTTMNKLCISKLLQYIDNQMVPADA